MAFGAAIDCALRVPPLLVSDFILSRDLLNMSRYPFLSDASNLTDTVVELDSSGFIIGFSRWLLFAVVFMTFVRVSLATRETLISFYRLVTLLLCIGVSMYTGISLLEKAARGLKDDLKSAVWYTFAIQLVCTTMMDLVATLCGSRLYNSVTSRVVTISCVFAMPVWFALPDFGQSARLASPTALSALRALQIFGSLLQTMSVVSSEWDTLGRLATLFRQMDPEAEPPGGAHVPERVVVVMEQLASVWSRVRMPRVLVLLALTRTLLDSVATPMALCSAASTLQHGFSLESTVKSRLLQQLARNTAQCLAKRDWSEVPFEDDCGLSPFDEQFSRSSLDVSSTFRCAMSFSRRIGLLLFMDVATMRLCDNVLALLATAACVSYASKACCALFSLIIFGRRNVNDDGVEVVRDGQAGVGEEEEAERQSVGVVAAVLFVVLALQSGLTANGADARRLRLARHALLIIVANMHVVERLCETRLTQLASRSDRHMARHVRVLLVSVFLLLAACLCVAALYAASSSGTFLLAVVVFNAELFVKTVCALLVYGVFALGTWRSRSEPACVPEVELSSSSSESDEEEPPKRVSKPCDDEDTAGRMDEVVYKVKAFASVFEFTCGCILLLNGIYIIVFESASLIRAAMMLLHAYANIWLQARRGWLAYRARRQAFQQLAKLRTCSPSDVRRYKNVCAICYRHMHALSQTVLRTHCDHLFHLVCLKKWLFARDSCPLCLQNAYGIPSNSRTSQ